MCIRRPNEPSKAPSWNLNKVLGLLNSLTSPLPPTTLLQKMAFLLLFATGYRISELHACVRSPAYCHVTRDSTLMIRPHPSFLAKKESHLDRWELKEVNPLQLPDGSSSNLCPVASSQQATECLWTHPKSGRPLTVRQLSSYVCKLIKRADPTAHVRVHDVRKYAASCTLASTLDVSHTVSALQWRSPRTLWRFYMTPTEPLAFPVVLPGAPGPRAHDKPLTYRPTTAGSSPASPATLTSI